MIKKLFILTFSFFTLGLINLNAQTILSEDFEGGSIPSKWTIQTKSTDLGWKVGTNSTLSSSNFTFETHTKFAATNDDKCQCDKSSDMLISPAFDLRPYTKIQLSFDQYFWGGYYTDGSGYKETASVKASIDGGKNWTTVCTIVANGDWYNQIADLSSYAGDSAVKLAFIYSDGGGGKYKNLYGLGLDNIKVFVPVDNDVQCVSVKLSECFRMQGNKSINGKLLNKGGVKLDSLTLNYQVDNDPVVSENFKNLKIAPANFYNYTFATQWTPTIGTHLIRVWATNVNGGDDQLTANDTVKFTTIVFKAGKPVLVEYFTSASCYYCGVYDPDMEKIMAQDNDFVIGLAYHAPLNGNPDPMYNNNNKSDFNTRVSFYKVTGYPTAYADGALCPGLLYYKSEYEVGSRTLKDTTLEINNPVALLTGNKLTFSADVVADKAISGSYKAYMAVIEQEITFATAPGTNGQTDFPWVMRKMIPDGNGVALPASMNIGDKQSVSGTWTVDASIYSREQLRVVFFVQNVTTKEVLWATILAPTVGIHEISNVSINEVFPNPCSKQANIFFSLIKSQNISLNVRNMLGQLITSKDLGIMPAGNNNYSLDVDALDAGVYFIEINSGKDSAVRKISVVK